MNRISRHQMWMEMAEVAAKRATCYRANNGAILVRFNNIISIGYNGPPSGEEHCTGKSCERTANGGCARALHAERNAIERATQPTRGAQIYCTMSPCDDCAFLILGAGVSAIYYRYPYRVSIKQLPIPIYRVTQAGDIINEHTGEFVSE